MAQVFLYWWVMKNFKVSKAGIRADRVLDRLGKVPVNLQGEHISIIFTTYPHEYQSSVEKYLTHSKWLINICWKK